MCLQFPSLGVCQFHQWFWKISEHIQYDMLISIRPFCLILQKDRFYFFKSSVQMGVHLFSLSY